MRFARGTAVVMLLAAFVTGCSKQQPQPVDEEPETNIVDRAPPSPVEAPPTVEPAPPKQPDPAANIANILPPDEAPSRDEQMMEDADATGLTARSAARSADTGPSSDPVGDLIANDGATN